MKKKLNISSKKMGLLLITVIVLAIVGGVLLYINSPKVKFVNLVNSEYQSFTSLVNKTSNSKLANASKTGPVISSGNIDFNIVLDDTSFGSLSSIIAAINGLKLNYEYGSDPTNNNIYLKLKSNIEDKDFIDMNLYQIGNKKYLYFKDIYDKYIESDNNNSVSGQIIQADDTLYLTNKIKHSVFLAVKASDFTTENKTIVVNTQSIDTEKISLKLTDKRLKEIVTAVLTDLKNDSRSLEILNKLSNGKDIKTELSKAISSLDKQKLLTDDLTVDVYAKDNKVVELDTFNGKTKSMEYLSYVAFNPTKRIILYDNHQSVLADAKFVLESANDVTYDIEFSNRQFVIQGTTSKVVSSSNKTWNMDLSLNLSLAYNKALLGTLKIDANTSTKSTDRLDIPSNFDSVKDADLTEIERKNIASKFLTKVYSALPSDDSSSQSATTISY